MNPEFALPIRGNDIFKVALLLDHQFATSSSNHPSSIKIPLIAGLDIEGNGFAIRNHGYLRRRFG